MSRLLLLFFTLYNILATSHGYSKNNFHNYEDRRQFLTYLADDHRIDNLSLIGSHVSAGYNEGSWTHKNQDLDILKQSDFGVRVLDIGLRPTSNHFAVHNGIFFMNLMFGRVIKMIKEFLGSYPRELVIMLIHQAHFEAHVTKTNCEILRQYIFHMNFISTAWTLSDEIGKHRGKILLMSMDNSFDKCVSNFFSQCKVSEEKLRNSWELVTEKQLKYNELKELQVSSFTEGYKCFINVIASRGNNARNIAIENNYFPSIGCEESINHQMANYFLNPKRALVIVMADFVTQELIDRVNFSNDFAIKSSSKNS